MKIIMESATGIVGSGVICGRHDIYLDGEIKGWLGLFGKVEMDHVAAGEHTITVISYERSSIQEKKVRFTATQDVRVWIRRKITSEKDRFEILLLGEDAKLLEERLEKS